MAILRIKIATVAALILTTLVTMAQPASAENPLYNELTNTGVKVTNNMTAKLPAPTVASGLAPDAEAAALKIAAGKYSIQDFTRKSTQAPFRLEQAPILDAAKKRVAQSVDLWFVVHGDLDVVGKMKIVQQMNNQAKKPKGPQAETKELTAEDLAKRNITPLATDELEEKFAFSTTPMLDQVFTSGVYRVVRSTNPKDQLAAVILDPRFAGDKEFPNQWQSISIDDLGQVKLGAPQPYEGFGGYGKLTPLSTPQGAVLVEFHAIFAEPYGWFEGDNLLGSKLPIVINDTVKDFRIRLIKAQQQAAQAAKAATAAPAPGGGSSAPGKPTP